MYEPYPPTPESAVEPAADEWKFPFEMSGGMAVGWSLFLVFLALIVLGVSLLVAIRGFGFDTTSPGSWVRPRNVYAFGDSTNDPGNLWLLDPDKITNQTDPVFPVPNPSPPPPVLPVISKQRFGPYHTNCDSTLANEFLSRRLEMEYRIGFAHSSIPSGDYQFIDYSISGAQQGTNGYLTDDKVPMYDAPSYEYQIQQYGIRRGDRKVQADDIFLLRAVGGNEFPAIMANHVIEGADIGEQINELVGKTVANVNSLYGLGARNIILELFDDGSPLPIVSKIGAVNPAIQTDLNALGAGMATAIETILLNNAPTSWPEINLIIKKQSTFREWMTANATKFGIVDDGVTMADQSDAGDVPNSNQRYWDDIHVSSATHRLWAKRLQVYVLECMLNINV